ncbi:MAG TPA: MBL fold metallo-hydrolase [Thermoanaerobaculia bacterium]|nr:MBL fold metallo-hydrolase [Thermoanaerobaculia bacterium]
MSTPLTIRAGRLTLQGSSRAGNETYFRVRELNVALDIGRCPNILIGVPDIFVTHAHLDHAAGIPFYAAQRKLQRLEPGTIYVPESNLDDFRALMEVHERLEDTKYRLEFVGMRPGESHALRRDLFVRAHRATHRVVANAYEFIQTRRKLRPELTALSGEEIGRMRAAGAEIAEDHESSLLLYTGDTDRRMLEECESLFTTAVLVIECSFTAPEDRGRATEYAHIHVEDLYDFAERFRNEVIVLTHFSLRDSPAEAHQEIASRCPAVLRERIRLALPEPYDRL